MQGIRMEPAHSILQNFNRAELERLARRGGVRGALPRTRPALINAITKHLDIGDIIEQVRRLFPAPRKAGARLPQGHYRLDQLPPLHGDATVQAFSRSRPETGLLLLDRGETCMAVDVGSIPLFLENRWPVMAVDAGAVPHSRLYAAFVRPGRVHPSA